MAGLRRLLAHLVEGGPTAFTAHASRARALPGCCALLHAAPTAHASTSTKSNSAPDGEATGGPPGAGTAFDWKLSKADLDNLQPPSDSLQTCRLAIDHPAPSFSADAVIDGEITELNASDYAGKWVLLFFYPKDFTFVCPTEIISFSDRVEEFTQRNCAVIGASTDSAEVHLAWIRTARRKGGLGHMRIPLIADVDRRVSQNYGVLTRDNFPNRGTYLIDPQGRLKAMQVLMNDVGRSVDEQLRLLDAFQFVAEHGVVCPANWKPGEATMVANPDESLDYFRTASASVAEQEEDIAPLVESIRNVKQYQEVLERGGKVVIDFMAGWCGKCRQIAPYFEELQTNYGTVAFYKIDTSAPELEGLADELGVRTLPCFKFFKDGREAFDPVIGYKKRPLEEAVERLNSL